MDVDERINEHNQEKFGDWIQKEKITFKVTNNITKKTINVTLEGDFITCKNCRDKILSGGFTWNQGNLQRKEIG
jgi:hypothetical protein